MFVGHAMLAFALGAGGARWTGCSRERSLSFGLLAGAFATAPDVDMLYALTGLLGGVSVTGFWSASALVHRVLTHSLVVGVASAIGFALFSHGFSPGRGDGPAWTDPRALSGLAVLGSILGVAGLESGSLGLAMMAAFVLVGCGVALAAVRLGEFGPRAILAAALLGLVSHPFGDLFTGEPPHFLYPVGVRPLTDRVLLSADPTLHLLGAFAAELATIWLAAVVYCRLTGRSTVEHVHWRAAFGVAYAGVALALPAPTVDSAYRFVASVLAVGVVGPAPLVQYAYRPLRYESDGRRTIGDRRDAPSIDGILTPALTGLAAVTLAGLSFGVVYAAI